MREGCELRLRRFRFGTGAIVALALTAAPAAGEAPKDAPLDPPPTIAWEHRLELGALVSAGPGEAGRELAIGAAEEDGTAIAMVVSPAQASARTGRVLLAAKLSPAGKLIWAKAYPGIPAGAISPPASLTAGRLAIFVAPPAASAPPRGRDLGRIVVIGADGALEHNFALAPPGSKIAPDQKGASAIRLALGVARGPGDGFFAFGEYGPAPPYWYLAAFERAGRRLWEHGEKSELSTHTRVTDVRVLAGGNIVTLIVRGAPGETANPRGLLRTYDGAGKMVQTRQLALGRLACYAFAGARNIVAAFEGEIAWLDMEGNRQRALTAPRLACPLAVGSDGTLVSALPDRGALDVLWAGPAGNRLWTIRIAGGRGAAPAMGGAFVAAIQEPGTAGKTGPILIRRYAAP